MRPPRPDIAAPELPPRLRWLGEAPGSMAELTASGPVLVHFFDYAQLNSVRALPYVIEWRRRYAPHGLAALGVQAPRFPFGFDPEAAAAGVARLGIEHPVALDAGRELWQDYGCSGWPSLFLWGPGGTLRWVHFGEGEYRATEVAIQEALREQEPLLELPPPLRPMRASDAPGARVMPPSEEVYPGGGPEHPWEADGEGTIELAYEGGGAHATVAGEGSIAVELDGEAVTPVEIAGPGLYTLAEHEVHERHRLGLRPSSGQRVWSLSFSAGVPADGAG